MICKLKERVINDNVLTSNLWLSPFSPLSVFIFKCIFFHIKFGVACLNFYYKNEAQRKRLGSTALKQQFTPAILAIYLY